MIKRSITMILLVFTTFLVSTGAVDQIVKTTYGLVGGIEEKTVHGTQFVAFYSIPFAEPPVGSLRLKPPVEPRPWPEVRNVTKWPSPCLQPTKSGGIKGDEDCLYLNVFIPGNKLEANNTLLPVMVFIHGGAFHGGDSSKYPPGYILEKPVILVTINYRLGPLGFLSYGTDELSGNFGLKDQSLALKWIQKNIGAFGGNPNEVTIFGESAGSASVHFHIFSPLSKGLFHRAIMQSGLATSTWATYKIDDAKAQTTTFAVLTGCHRKNLTQMLSCFQKLKAKEFIKAMYRLYPWGTDPVTIFRPTIEGEGINNVALPKELESENYQSLTIPVIIGTNSGEGTFRLLEYLKNNGTQLKEIDEEYHRLFPLVLGYQFTVDPEKCEKLSSEIREYYFQNKSISAETDVKVVQMLSDILFLQPLDKFLKQYPATKYLYVYDCKTNCSDLGSNGCYKDEYGANHGDELDLLFPKSKLTDSEKLISSKLIELWTNFAIHGNPNGPTKNTVWLPVVSNQKEYLHITPKEISMKNNYNVERVEFLNKLFVED